MKLIVGLGNPGEEYKKTKHNIGFTVVNQFLNSNFEILNKFQIQNPNFQTNKKLQAEIAEGEIKGEKIVLAKPVTFMNESGIAVNKLVISYRLSVISDLIIVHDDITIPLGEIKISVGGGAGNHNGVQSVIDHLKTQDFIRVRIGIGRGNGTLSDVVLSTFTKDERVIIDRTIQKACEIITHIIVNGVEKAMNKYNMRSE